jgi:hypothetical protein
VLLIKEHRYDEIRNLYVEQLAYVWVEDQTEATRTNIEKKIDSFVEGDLEHAAEMVSGLWKIINQEGEVKAPSNTSSTVSRIRALPAPVLRGILITPDQTTPVKSPAHWDSVKTAIIKSIRTGVFFDRKYWVRHSASGNVLKPAYFSSAIMDDKAQQLNKRTWIFGPWYIGALSILSGEIPHRPE